MDAAVAASGMAAARAVGGPTQQPTGTSLGAPAPAALQTPPRPPPLQLNPVKKKYAQRPSTEGAEAAEAADSAPLQRRRELTAVLVEMQSLVVDIEDLLKDKVPPLNPACRCACLVVPALVFLFLYLGLLAWWPFIAPPDANGEPASLSSTFAAGSLLAVMLLFWCVAPIYWWRKLFMIDMV